MEVLKFCRDLGQAGQHSILSVPMYYLVTTTVVLPVLYKLQFESNSF